MRQSTKAATLILEDGTRFEGRSFGHHGSTSGEVVFNTAMTGYPESLTDPSYEGQILITTYPILGSYGVPPEGKKDSVSRYYESERIHCRAIVAQDYSWDPSHWQADRSLAQWLRDEKIPGIFGVDTRALTKHLRDKGSMLGKIIVEGCGDVDFHDPNLENLVAKVSCKEVEEFGSGNKTVVLIDCGVKHNIIRCLTHRGVKVIMVPWDYDFSREDYDGLFLSNGPGDPSQCGETIAHIAAALKDDRPIMGICLGNQLLARAAGASTYKLKYGHRGHNQPVTVPDTDKCYITSQNHGFAIDDRTLPEEWQTLFVNVNDGTNEGIRHRSKPFFSTQYHPEASSGPVDTEYLFDEFIGNIKIWKASKK